MANLNISLLGTVRVTTDDGRPIPLPTDKAQALLAYLALQADRPHPRETLATLLWPQSDDSKAHASLRQGLYVLNKALDVPGARLFTTTRRDVLLKSGPLRLDVTAFTGLIDACHSHPHRSLDTCFECAERLQRAVDLYRGDLQDDAHPQGGKPAAPGLRVGD